MILNLIISQNIILLLHNIILENKMDYQIVNEYMARKYSAYTWVLKQGNNCVWVIMNNINMYFTVKDNKIIRIDID
jgi:hypothetical protein